MEYLQHLWLYVLLVGGIILVPGMDMLFVLANALAGGRRAGLAATAGMMVGGACHTAIGLSAVVLLARVLPALFGPMLVLGSLYMLWVGYGLLRSAIVVESVETQVRRRQVGVFLQALVTCLVNPKAWLFVVSVFPQFLKQEYGPLLPQALAMGVVTVVLQGGIYGAVALGALRTREALVGNASATIWIGRGAGALLAAAALMTLLQAFAYL